MKFDKPAGENPIDQLKVVGRPHDRIDGPLKTTGTARYAYEWHEEAPNAAYGYIVGSAIAKGRLTALDTDAAQKEPGVLAVITASNAECGGWCMSAVTTSAETVSPWTMGRNVSVSSLFPTPCCAGGFGRRYCRRIRNWKRRCSIG